MSPVSYEQIREKLQKAKSYSSYVAALCPFHDDRGPSLLVYEDNYFKCLGCGVSGNHEKLWRKLTGKDASRTIRAEETFSAPYLPRDLREQEELTESAHSTLVKYSQFQWYLENRGVTGRIEPNRLGWYKGWYTIPVYSRYGTYQGMVARASSVIQKVTEMRFIQPFGQHSMMFCPDWRLMETCPSIAVVFGMFDALALADLRFAVVTPTMGQDNFNPAWLDSFRKKIVIIPDAHEESAAVKLAGKLGWRSVVARLEYEDGIKDPAGYLEKGKRSQLQSLIGGVLS